MTVQVKADKIHVKIEVQVRSGLGNQTTYTDLSTPDQFKSWKRGKQKSSKGDRSSPGESTEYGADIFGFGQQLYGHDNRAWQRLAADWERHFREATVEIKVKAVLVELGLTTRPVLD